MFMNNNKNFAYKVGYILGTTLAISLAVVTIACVIKFLIWLF